MELDGVGGEPAGNATGKGGIAKTPEPGRGGGDGGMRTAGASRGDAGARVESGGITMDLSDVLDACDFIVSVFRLLRFVTGAVVAALGSFWE